ncbi:MAG: hypothetical protein ABSB96_10750 [Gaiellaceae bacterium]
MLATIDAGDIATLAVIVALIAFGLSANRGAKRIRNSLEIRDGRVALKEEVRLRLERNPRRLHRIEALIASTYTVNERGEIVARGDTDDVRAPAPEPVSRPAKSASSQEDERFCSAWDEQDAGSSIWDEQERAAFWGDTEERD